MPLPLYPLRCARVLLLAALTLGALLGTGCAGDDASDASANRAAAAADGTETPRPDSLARAGTSAGSATRPPAADSAHVTVLVLGNSIAAGYGLPEPSRQAFPARMQQTVDSLGWSNVRIVNAGLSGDTTAGGLRRLDWLLRRPIDILVIELGGNDGLRGVDPEATRANLAAMIETARARYPDVRVVLVQVPLPPNLGPDYVQRFDGVFPAVAQATDARLVPFVLDDVTRASSLLQDDGIHPTAAGHRLVARTVWDALRPLVAEVRAEEGVADTEKAE
jgi:acyl-CoA thioesterase-1